MQSDDESEPLGEVLLFGQSRHHVLPVLFWYWPLEQLVQELWMWLRELWERYFPAWQIRHVPYVPP